MNSTIQPNEEQIKLNHSSFVYKKQCDSPQTVEGNPIIPYKQGNFKVITLPKLIVLLFWSIIIAFFYYPRRGHFDNQWLFFFLLSIPYLVVLYETISHRFGLFSDKAETLLSWNPCFTKIDNDDNIKGIWDYKCGADQIKYLQDALTSIQKNFYYINYALFLLILVYHKVMISDSSRNITSNTIVFVCLALFIGSIGILPTAYSDSYVHSLRIKLGYTVLLNMNMAAFLIVLYSLMK